MKAGHGAVGFVSQFQDGVAEFQIGDLQSARGGVLKILFETEVFFVEGNRAIEIADVDGDVVDALEHDVLLQLAKHRLLGCEFASS